MPHATHYKINVEAYTVILAMPSLLSYRAKFMRSDQGIGINDNWKRIIEQNAILNIWALYCIQS